MAKRSSYQDRVIRKYYENREAISLQRLGELVSELYLAEGKKRDQAWKRIAAALENLDVPQSRIDHLMSRQDPALVAQLVNELLAK